jgi:TonB family protein
LKAASKGASWAAYPAASSAACWAACPDPGRPLRMPRPEYPNEAFVKKVEGTVVVQIVIDEHGRVSEARVVHSIPMLDEAALRAVRTWAFIPALRGGQPVASIAMAPVTFRIY